jgi:hypothetical protein
VKLTGEKETFCEKAEQWLWAYIQRPVVFFYQRLTRGWDDSETWNLDYTVAKLMAPRIRRYKELAMSHPSTLTEEEWDTILGKVLWSFDYILDEDRDNFLPESAKMTSREMDILCPWFKKVEASEEEEKATNDKWQHYMEVSEALDNRCQEGLDLFGKWMRGMWW